MDRVDKIAKNARLGRAFFVEEEVAVLAIVHEEVFGEDSGAAGVAEKVEVFLEVGVGVGVVGAETKPVKMPAVVDKQIVYRDSIVFRDHVQTETVEVERKLTGWQQAKLRVGGFCFFAVIMIGLYSLITQFINFKLF